jgi:hypothetical protein
MTGAAGRVVLLELGSFSLELCGGAFERGIPPFEIRPDAVAALGPERRRLRVATSCGLVVFRGLKMTNDGVRVAQP